MNERRWPGHAARIGNHIFFSFQELLQLIGKLINSFIYLLIDKLVVSSTFIYLVI